MHWSVQFGQFQRNHFKRAKHIEDERLRELKTQYEVAQGRVLNHEVAFVSRLSDCII